AWLQSRVGLASRPLTQDRKWGGQCPWPGRLSKARSQKRRMTALERGLASPELRTASREQGDIGLAWTLRGGGSVSYRTLQQRYQPRTAPFDPPGNFQFKQHAAYGRGGGARESHKNVN